MYVVKSGRAIINNRLLSQAAQNKNDGDSFTGDGERLGK